MRNRAKLCILLTLLFCGAVAMSCNTSQRNINNSTEKYIEMDAEPKAEELRFEIDNESISPLHAACNSSHIDKDLIRKLVKEGADINDKDYIDKEHSIALTPLMIACNRSDIDEEAVKLLIELGADPNEQAWASGFDKPNYEDKTALMFAVDRSKVDTEALRVLVKMGADINATGDKDRTPIMYACNHDSVDDDAVALLIKLGADVNLVDSDEKNAVMIAADRVHPDLPVLEMLMNNGTDVNHLDEEGKNILMYPGVLRSLKLTQRIIDMGGDIHVVATGDNEIDLLGCAAAFGTKDVVQFYLNQGMNVNRRRSDGQTPVMLAAWGNTLDVVKLLVDAGADLSITANDGFTVLMSACSQKRGVILIDRAQADVVEYLLESGANVKEEEEYGQTVMSYIVMNKKDVIDVVDLLLKYGADLNHRSKDGSTPLDWATNPDVTKYIISKGANVHTKTDNLYTPLHYAVKNNKLDVAQVLLDAGIDKHAKTENGKDVRHFANTVEAIDFLYKNGYQFNDVWTDIDDYYMMINNYYSIESSNLLLKRLKVGGGMDNPKLGNEIIECFVDSGSLPITADEVTEELVRRNPDVLNEQGPKGYTPLELSMHKYLNDHITAFLVKHGAKFSEKKSPFEFIFKHADTSHELVRSVIDSGADVNVKIDTFLGAQIPVLCMIASQTPGVVKDALAAGANPNVSDTDGATPLMRTFDIDAVNQLIKAGANVNAKLNNGKSVLMIHAGHGTYETVKALIDAGAIVDEETLLYAQDKDIAALMKKNAKDIHYSLDNLLYLDDITDEMVKDVIKQGMDINEPMDEYNQTLLTFACRSGEANKIKILLNNGADPNILNTTDGMTPFMLAVSEWKSPNTMDVETIKALIKAGAKVNSKSDSGMTPVMYAAYMPREGLSSDIIKLLINSGADLKATDKLGRNVLFYLSYQLEPKIVKLLIDKGANPLQKDKEGGTPLMRQCEPEIIKILINAKVDVKAQNKEGKTALIALTEFCDNPKSYELLINAGVDINHKDKEGRNALYYAVHNYQHDAIHYLLDSGIDVNAKDNSGKTVIETIDPSPFTPELVNLLRAHGATGTPVEGWDKKIHIRY